MENLLSNLIIEKVCSVTTMYSEAGAQNSRYNREKWAIIIKYEGETVYINNGKSILSNINNIVILPCGCNYEWECLRSGNYISIEFQSSTKSAQILSFSVNNGDEILKILKKLEYKRLSKNPMYRIESIRDVYTVILKLTEKNARDYIPSAKSDKLMPAVKYMLDNYTSCITNSTLASLIGVSTVYFRKLFKDIYGISPMEYVKNLRIKKAKEMLHCDFGSITEIAVSLGYRNIYDFSRDFKKHVGISPSKYISEF